MLIVFFIIIIILIICPDDTFEKSPIMIGGIIIAGVMC